MDRSTINSYETVMQGFPLPAFILHVDLTVHSWNEAAESCWGWSAQEVTGQLIPLLNSEDAAFSRQIWHSFLEKRQSMQLPNTTFLHKSGERSIATLLVSPLFDEKNEPFGAFFCQLPSSTQQNASKPLFQGLMDLRYAFDQIACVAIFDARGTIQYANTNLTDVTGFCPHLLLGQPWTILLDSSEEALPLIRSQIKKKKAWSGKLSISTQEDSKKSFVPP